MPIPHSTFVYSAPFPFGTYQLTAASFWLLRCSPTYVLASVLATPDHHRDASLLFPHYLFFLVVCIMARAQSINPCIINISILNQVGGTAHASSSHASSRSCILAGHLPKVLTLLFSLFKALFFLSFFLSFLVLLTCPKVHTVFLCVQYFGLGTFFLYKIASFLLIFFIYMHPFHAWLFVYCLMNAKVLLAHKYEKVLAF